MLYEVITRRDDLDGVEERPHLLQVPPDDPGALDLSDAFRREQPRPVEEKGFFRTLDAKVSAPLLLFQKHFLLFHVLYVINRKLVKDKQGAVQITPLMIKKLDYVEAGTQVGAVDALSEYYLDLNNLETANEDNVS